MRRAVAASFVLLGAGALGLGAFVVGYAAVDGGDAGDVLASGVPMLPLVALGVGSVRHGLRYGRTGT